MKNNKIKIYLVVALLLIIGVGYAYLNQNVELDNDVTISSYTKQGVPAPYDVTILSGQRGNLQPGDKIRIGQSEDFYVISSDNNTNGKTVLLAKNNLLVGNIVENGTITGQIATNVQGYGLQSDTATGFVGDSTSYSGSIAFSGTTYWDDGNGTLVSPYNENGASYMGNPYPVIFDSNSTIYPYINGQDGYVERLKTMGAPSTITGRLLTYEEADLVQDVEDNDTSIILDGRQSYWLGSTYGNDSVLIIYSSIQSIGYGQYNNGINGGIRPVIEINTSDI